MTDQLRAAVPLQCAAEPEEVAGAVLLRRCSGTVLFLCSDAASYDTGKVSVVGASQMIRGLLPVGEVRYVG